MSSSQTQAVAASALQILLDHYPSQLRIPLREAARWMGIAGGTARNHACAGTFPIPTFRFGDLRLVDIRDLANYLDVERSPGLKQPPAVPEGAPAPSPSTAGDVRRGRGRPRKIQQGAAK